MTHPPEDCLVHVVDDDSGLRRSLRFLLDSVGWGVRLHASAEEFLDLVEPPRQPSCLLLDIRMPAMSGLELQQVLRERGIDIPILFMTGHADVSMAVQAMKSGAADFIEKPFKDQVVLDAVAAAIRRSAEALEEGQRRAAAQALLASFSPREKEAARLIALVRAVEIEPMDRRLVLQSINALMEVDSATVAAELARLMLRANPAALD